jgi:hypothetical protein
MNIYIARDGTTYGPYDLTQAREYLAQAVFRSDDLACLEGGSDWYPLSQILSRNPAKPLPTPSPNPKAARPVALFLAVFGGIVLAGVVLIFCWQHFTRTSRSQLDRSNPFAEEERKDRYELLKTEYRMQENLPQVISFFRDNQDADPSSIQAQTHQKIAELCEELSTIVPKIIAAKADNSVSSLISRQREILKSFDAILAEEHADEMETRLHVGEYAAERIGIDREYNQKALAILNQ